MNIVIFDPVMVTTLLMISGALYGIINRLYTKRLYKSTLKYLHTKYVLTWKYETFRYWAVVAGVFFLATVAVIASRYLDLYSVAPDLPTEYHDLALLEDASFVRLFGVDPETLHWVYQIIEGLLTIVTVTTLSAIANYVEKLGGGGKIA